VLGAVFFALAFAVGPCPACGDTLELIDGKTVKGIVREISNGKVHLTPEGAAKPAPAAARRNAVKNTAPGGVDGKPPAGEQAPQAVVTYPLDDVVHLGFEPVLDRTELRPPLIDNDRAGTGRSLSGTIKLRAGYHRIVLPYWHNSGRTLLRLQYSYRQKGRSRGLRIAPPSMLFHAAPNSTETPSPGKDKEGYRVGEALTQPEPGLTYSARRLTREGPFRNIADLLTSQIVTASGTMPRIAPLSDDSENVALLLTGYIHVTEDAEYTFLLSSDGGSQLFLGETPALLRHVDTAVRTMPWSVVLRGEGALPGRTLSWKEGKVVVQVGGGNARELSVPLERVAEIWSNAPAPKTGPRDADQIDRTNLTPNQDSIYARSTSGRIQRVAGRVKGINDKSLVLQFGGEDRTISLEKLAGVILAADRASTDHERDAYQVVETAGGLKMPGRLTSFKGVTAAFRTLWGDEIGLDANELTALSPRNGKVVFVTDLVPADVKQVPFFDRLIGYRVNESLSGGPLELQDGRHRRGISVHAQSVLTYRLPGAFQRFRARVGFQVPEGRLGDAAVRILGDDKVLFERASLRGDGPVETVDVDVNGIRSLTFAVDFGNGDDVGDRVVFADPMLIRETRTATSVRESGPAR
jgi:hypothetical protein